MEEEQATVWQVQKQALKEQEDATAWQLQRQEPFEEGLQECGLRRF